MQEDDWFPLVSDVCDLHGQPLRRHTAGADSVLRHVFSVSSRHMWLCKGAGAQCPVTR
ncbi:hypothetical protein GCM10014715_56470 [Streptomyces spiralis]|uniref:Uncharacterized protein n=1 Tax=Streptomyces spiralis TaxID=66376 RepID=A0A919DYS2_9ACTN|nr:hypothetical protein GCM10014715_56470 [Streptomyces spiralis]